MRVWPWVFVTAFAANAQTLTVTGSNSPYTIAAATTFAQVTVAGDGKLIVNAPLTVTGDMLVQGGGEVTVDQSAKVLKLNVSGTLTVDFGASIHADAKGLLGGDPTTNGGESLEPVTYAVIRVGGAATGGSFASHGVPSQYNPGADPYGNPLLAQPGGGGSSSGGVGSFGGNGGGVVTLTAGTLVLNGQLRADGAGGISGGGGAGGSVFVTVGAWQGSGGLSANGGGQLNSSVGGAGRIKVTFTTFAFGGTFSAFSNGVPAGTIYLIDTSNRFRVASSIALTGGESFAAVTFLPNSSLELKGKVTIQGPITVPIGSTLTASAANVLDSLSLTQVDGALVTKADQSLTTDLVVSGEVTLDAELRVPNLTTVSGAVIRPLSQSRSMRVIVAGTLTLVDGARIDGSGAGLKGGFQSVFADLGSTIDPGTGQTIPGSGRGNGGTHAGLGGVRVSTNAVAPVYDDPAVPSFPGGGGGGAYDVYANPHQGGSGGGVVRLTATTAVINGAINVDGLQGDVSNDTGPAGSGAGGTAVLAFGTATGHGTISARGGTGGIGAGGGGGLIHLTASSLASTIVLTAAGGTGSYPGAAGIVTSEVSAGGVAPKIVSTAPTTAKSGQTLSYAAAATGTTPITWALTSAPAGATVSAQGVVNWLAAGTTPQIFTLQATNGSGTDAQTFTVQVLTPPTITSQAKTETAVAVPYFYDADSTATATGSAPLTWSLLAGPTGFTIDSVTGAIGWTPAALGGYSACIRVENAAGSAQQCFSVTVSAHGTTETVADGGVGTGPVFTSSPTTTAFCGAPYHYSGSHTPDVTGSGPFVFSVSTIAGSTLPTGLTVDSTTGDFGWTPSKDDVGTHPIVLSVSNSAGSATQTFSIVVECKDNQKVSVGCSSVPGEALWLLALALFGVRRGTSRRYLSPYFFTTS